MHSEDGIAQNIDRIAQLFPNCITEIKTSSGDIERAIDFDKLKSELSCPIADGNTQRYQFTWPDKLEASRLANTPTTSCLRPCRDESVDFDHTQNLYIEGDNLEVLKVLRHTYSGKVKMIYIDPPYNTGNDFVYEDDFACDQENFLLRSGQKDASGNRLVANSNTNGRFHTDWLNMMYPRLKLARELLSDDGLIFISIGDEEVYNLRSICNEIFGPHNFVNTFSVRRYNKNLNRQFIEHGLKSLNIGFEYVLCFKKDNALLSAVYKATDGNRVNKGYWKSFWNNADRPTMRYELLGVTPQTGQWKTSAEKAYQAVANYQEYLDKYSASMSLEEYWHSTGETKTFIRRNASSKSQSQGVDMWIPPSSKMLRSTDWNDILASKHFDITKGLFDSPKNIDLLKILLETSGNKQALVLDFFSGSATTAHAVMHMNATDGGNRKFIMVQLPEELSQDSEGFKAGFKNICEIGKERIRRAGAAIKEEFGEKAADLDIGFRVLKLDSSNMKDTYYAPAKLTMASLIDDNLKADRTSEDLLFQAMLETDVLLSEKIERLNIGGKEVFSVSDGFVMACFDNELDMETVKEIASKQPSYFITRNASFENDALVDNLDQIFKAYSPDCIVRII